MMGAAQRLRACGRRLHAPAAVAGLTDFTGDLQRQSRRHAFVQNRAEAQRQPGTTAGVPAVSRHRAAHDHRRCPEQSVSIRLTDIVTADVERDRSARSQVPSRRFVPLQACDAACRRTWRSKSDTSAPAAVTRGART